MNIVPSVLLTVNKCVNGVVNLDGDSHSPIQLVFNNCLYLECRRYPDKVNFLNTCTSY